MIATRDSSEKKKCTFSISHIKSLHFIFFTESAGLPFSPWSTPSILICSGQMPTTFAFDFRSPLLRATCRLTTRLAFPSTWRKDFRPCVEVSHRIIESLHVARPKSKDFSQNVGTNVTCAQFLQMKSDEILMDSTKTFQIRQGGSKVRKCGRGFQVRKIFSS